MDAAISLTSVLKRDRTVVVLSLSAVALLAWVFTFTQARQMAQMDQGMPGCTMPSMLAWHPSEFIAVFVMWMVMMAAMMLPSVAPMALTFAFVNRQRREKQNPFVPTWIFLCGYMAVWTAFSLLATAVQWYLHQKALVSPMMVSTSPLLSGGLLILTGIFQLTPLKNTCLTHCRTPLNFLMTDWGEGQRGAFWMGLRHGVYCTGCCWVLMMLLFALGVMNLFWIAVISIFVLLEKIAPKPFRLSFISGFLLIGWGWWLIVGNVK